MSKPLPKKITDNDLIEVSHHAHATVVARKINEVIDYLKEKEDLGQEAMVEWHIAKEKKEPEEDDEIPF